MEKIQNNDKQNKHIIKLNVRGRQIQTLKDTLMNLNYFKNYFERWDNSEEIFIDCDPKIFNHLLNLISLPKYEIPINKKTNVEHLMDYYNSIKSRKKLLYTENLYFHDRCSITLNHKLLGLILRQIELHSDYDEININLSNENNSISINDKSMIIFFNEIKDKGNPIYELKSGVLGYFEKGFGIDIKIKQKLYNFKYMLSIFYESVT